MAITNLSLSTRFSIMHAASTAEPDPYPDRTPDLIKQAEDYIAKYPGTDKARQEQIALDLLRSNPAAFYKRYEHMEGISPSKLDNDLTHPASPPPATHTGFAAKIGKLKDSTMHSLHTLEQRASQLIHYDDNGAATKTTKNIGFAAVASTGFVAAVGALAHRFGWIRI